MAPRLVLFHPSMRILFVHQGFPGQFLHLAPALAADPANEVAAIMLHREGLPESWKNVRLHPYKIHRPMSETIHPWLSETEVKLIRGDACMRAALQMKAQGFEPDVIVAHPGWGDSLFLKDVWPGARLGIYCEFFYRHKGTDVGFDPEFSEDAHAPEKPSRMRLKNTNNLLHMEVADAGISPTQWQASTFPGRFRDRITVVHDGIDCDALVPNPAASAALGGGKALTRGDEVITFVNRNLEPYRGYHVFMRALPELLRRRPHARVMIVGGDGVSYGARPPGKLSWRDQFLAEVQDRIAPEDLQRIHFLGNLPYADFVTLLQLSAVHVYLTYPFVLSWSLMEAMSIGCAIVGSDTAPVREVIEDGVTGRLVDFFDHGALTDAVCALLDDPAERARLGARARETVRERYDLKTVCLPRQIEWVRSLYAMAPRPQQD